MKGKTVSGVILTLLLFGVLPSVFNIQPVEAPVSPYSPAGGIKLNPPSIDYFRDSYCYYNNTKFNVTVLITNITGCEGLQFKIDYNSTLITLDSWTFNTDPANPQSPTQMTPAPANRIDTDVSVPGSVMVATIWKYGVPPYTYAGDSVVARLTFKIIYCPPQFINPGFNSTVSTSIAFDRTNTYAVDHNGDDILFATFNDSYYEYTTAPVFGSKILAVYSSPPGVTFTVNGVPHTTPWSDWLEHGIDVTVIMPETHDGACGRYDWKSWEHGGTNRTKTFPMFSFVDLTALYQLRPIGRVEYDYYVVAGHQLTPTLPPPAPQPADFTFTLEAFAEGLSTGGVLTSLGTGGYDFGNLSYHGYRTYLTAGSSISEPTGENWNAYVVVNITNNLGYTINIEDLTAEVTDGTPKGYGLPGDQWLYPISGENVANCSMVALDTFDPWDYNNIDEVNYETGVVEQIREDDYPDHFRAATGTIRPSRIGRGPGSLLSNDLNGDAAATGHVAPKYGGSTITLNDGETFTDYFGVNILGDVAVGTQINATITLRLYYSPPPNGTAALVDVQMSNLQPLFPCFFYGPTTYIYPRWESLKLNVSIQNLGIVPVNVTVNVYYSTDYGGNWIQIGSSQSVSDLSVTAGHLFTFYWNVREANLEICWKFIKANATATNQNLTATCDFNVRVRTVLEGNCDGDDDVDVGDQRKMQLAMFTSAPQQGYFDWQNRDQYGPQIFTDMDGDCDVDVGDQRKQQIWMFCEDWCEPKT